MHGEDDALVKMPPRDPPGGHAPAAVALRAYGIYMLA
jgi:hypothetical protein